MAVRADAFCQFDPGRKRDTFHRSCSFPHYYYATREGDHYWLDTFLSRCNPEFCRVGHDV